MNVSLDNMSALAMDSTSDHISNPAPGQRCTCGCVPNIFSLFEMAELRAKHRQAMREKDKRGLENDEKESISSSTHVLLVENQDSVTESEGYDTVNQNRDCP